MITLSHTKKPTRKEAFDLACKAKSHHLTESEIDSLINYFAPSVPSSPKTAFQWVARAVAINDIRQYLQFVHVSDGVMYATDGHRLHWANTDLANGYYDAKTGARVDDKFVRGSYPDVRRAMPKLERMQEIESLVQPPATEYIKSKQYFTLTYNGVKFNKIYVDSAMPEKAFVDSHHMRGSNIFGEFVIMNMRA